MAGYQGNRPNPNFQNRQQNVPQQRPQEQTAAPIVEEVKTMPAEQVEERSQEPKEYEKNPTAQEAISRAIVSVIQGKATAADATTALTAWFKTLSVEEQKTVRENWPQIEEHMTNIRNSMEAIYQHVPYLVSW